jgi:hypothetical protein
MHDADGAHVTTEEQDSGDQPGDRGAHERVEEAMHGIFAVETSWSGA